MTEEKGGTMPAKKMKAKAKRTAAKKSGMPFTPPACDPTTGKPRKTTKKKK
jgi:hypothetical protein